MNPTPTTAAMEPAAIYIGFQEGITALPGFHLYNLTRDFPPHHSAGSTVSAEALQQLGIEIPAPTPEGIEAAARDAHRVNFYRSRRSLDSRSPFSAAAEPEFVPSSARCPANTGKPFAR